MCKGPAERMVLGARCSATSKLRVRGLGVPRASRPCVLPGIVLHRSDDLAVGRAVDGLGLERPKSDGLEFTGSEDLAGIGCDMMRWLFLSSCSFVHVLSILS